jgi:hypothetical protein
MCKLDRLAIRHNGLCFVGNEPVSRLRVSASSYVAPPGQHTHLPDVNSLSEGEMRVLVAEEERTADYLVRA